MPRRRSLSSNMTTGILKRPRRSKAGPSGSARAGPRAGIDAVSPPRVAAAGNQQEGSTQSNRGLEPGRKERSRAIDSDAASYYTCENRCRGARYQPARSISEP